MLDRFGAVAPDGSYSSPIRSESRRFFTMLGTLVSGRVSVTGAALGAAKLALTIAVRYGLQRRQFRAPGTDQEVILLDYLQHQRRLFPALATTYALHFAQEALVNVLRHSKSNEVRVDLSFKKQEVRLEITDKGQGFDLEESRDGQGFGLISMQERAEYIGGRFRVETHPGQGTRIGVDVPLKK